jgi:hypothetical protein
MGHNLLESPVSHDRTFKFDTKGARFVDLFFLHHRLLMVFSKCNPGLFSIPARWKRDSKTLDLRPTSFSSATQRFFSSHTVCKSKLQPVVLA